MPAAEPFLVQLLLVPRLRLVALEDLLMQCYLALLQCHMGCIQGYVLPGQPVPVLLDAGAPGSIRHSARSVHGLLELSS